MSRPDQGGQALGHAREAQVFKGTTDAGPEAVVVIVTKLMGQCLMELLESSETRWGRRYVSSESLTLSLATLSHCCGCLQPDIGHLVYLGYFEKFLFFIFISFPWHG